MEATSILLILAILFGFVMAWGIGANDVANAMGTSVGSRSLTIRQAILVAAVFECAGALLAGGQVTDTIRGKIIDIELLSHTPELIVYGMLAALLAAGIWLVVASQQGWPVSTTHSIIGAIIGFGLVNLGVDAVYWNEVTNIALSWVITPFIAGIIAYAIFTSIQKIILASQTPLLNAKRYLPIYIFFVGLVVSLVTLFKGLKHINLHITSSTQGFWLAVGISLTITAISYFALRRIPEHEMSLRKSQYLLEKVFAVLVVFTACAVAFAHGSNDVANAIGPLAAIVNLLQDSQVNSHSTVPFWLLALGAGGIIAGLATYGYRVIATIGKNITHLTPSRAFAAEIATASTVVMASGAGLPVSTTQTLVGSVLGVGFAGGISAIKLNVIRNIFMSWIITLPAGAILAIIFFYILHFVFG